MSPEDKVTAPLVSTPPALTVALVPARVTAPSVLMPLAKVVLAELVVFTSPLVTIASKSASPADTVTDLALKVPPI